MSNGRSITQDTLDGLRSLIEAIVKGIVDNPEAVEVVVVPATYRVLVELHTAATDVGQVIGRQGSVVESIRCLLSAYGGKHRIRIDLDYATEQKKLSERG
jgi:predicted RNA-binding protein YlqC (UPF0109 family)